MHPHLRSAMQAKQGCSKSLASTVRFCLLQREQVVAGLVLPSTSATLEGEDGPALSTGRLQS